MTSIGTTDPVMGFAGERLDVTGEGALLVCDPYGPWMDDWVNGEGMEDWVGNAAGDGAENEAGDGVESGIDD